MNDLIPTVRLFGRLFLREVDAPLLQTLQQPDIVAGMKDLGVEIPADPDTATLLEQLSTEYCDSFLIGPHQIPLVQSIHEHSTYEARSSQALRELAAEADLELDDDLARNVPVDHLGSILLLWAELVEDGWTEGHQHITEHHLNWAVPPLQQLSQRDGFYPELAQATLLLVHEIQNS